MTHAGYTNQQSKNRAFGDGFEKILEARARSNGLLALKNELSARWVGKGRVQAIKSDLDYRIIQRGKPFSAVAYVDAKTFDNAYVDFSWLKEHQVDQARIYWEWGLPTGFICWLRKLDIVVFYSYPTIVAGGPGTRFHPRDGISLGTIAEFDLRAIFTL